MVETLAQKSRSRNSDVHRGEYFDKADWSVSRCALYRIKQSVRSIGNGSLFREKEMRRKEKEMPRITVFRVRKKKLKKYRGHRSSLIRNLSLSFCGTELASSPFISKECGDLFVPRKYKKRKKNTKFFFLQSYPASNMCQR